MQTNPMRTHTCGGTIIRHGSPDPAADPRDYLYCDRCGAFRYFGEEEEEEDGPPSGTDREANRAAWDDGDDASPEADRKGDNAVTRRYQVLEMGLVIGEYDDLDEALSVAQEANDEHPDDVGDGCATVYDTVAEQWMPM